ncbi:MAG: hypothetical protein AAGF94_13660 [Pseudomonadota bacterium]
MRITLLAFAFAGATTYAHAASLPAIDDYYTFVSAVSANSGTRLLVDKASAIPAIAGLDSTSFLLFDAGALPGASLAATRQKAILKLEYDPGLASTLIPATSARPLSVSVYGIDGMWDDTVGGSGNLAGIDFGIDGSNAYTTTLVRDAGIYKWDVSDLVDDWIDGTRPLTALALSGLFGNVNDNDRNAYASFYAVGATDGAAASIHLAPIPLPSTAFLLMGAFGAVGATRLRSARHASG